MFTFIFALALNFAHAAPGTVRWHATNTKIICGGMADGKDLNFKTVLPDELLNAESEDGRLLIYIDLKKPGTVHFVFAEALADADYDRREGVLTTLKPEDADFLRTLSPTRQSQLYMGLTDGIVNMDFQTKYHSLSLSCREMGEE